MNAASKRRQQSRLRHGNDRSGAKRTSGAAAKERKRAGRTSTSSRDADESPVFAIADVVEAQLVLEHNQKAPDDPWTRPLLDVLEMGDYYDSVAMGGFLLIVANKLKDDHGFDFVYDQAFVDDAVGYSLGKLKLEIAKVTT